MVERQIVSRIFRIEAGEQAEEIEILRYIKYSNYNRYSGGGSGGVPKFNYHLLTGTNAETLELGSAYQANISGDDDKPVTIPDTTETGQLILVARESNGDDTGNVVISVTAGSSTRIRTPDNQVATSYTLGNSGSNQIQAVLLMSSENSAGDAEYLAIQLGEHSDIPS